jgi:hypothetical protein
MRIFGLIKRCLEILFTVVIDYFSKAYAGELVFASIYGYLIPAYVLKLSLCY